MAGVSLSIVRSASQQLTSLLVEEVKFLYDVTEKMEKLQLHLECMQCFLEDAERNHYTSHLIHRWIFQIREFAYEAENIIDKYMVRVSCPQRKQGIWNTIKWFSCIMPDVQSLHEVGSDVDTLSRRITELTSIMQLCGLKVDVTQDSGLIATQVAELRKTNAQIEEDDFFIGFDKDVSKLVHYLVDTDKMVVAISGMGGLGKTTLAKMVCNDKIIKQRFNGFVWVFISQQFTAREVIELIWRELRDENEKKDMDTIQLCKQIKRKLQSKKYLIVLDDIWNEESWDRLKDAFPSNQESCSKLLLTTRNEDLLKHVDEHNGYLHQPSCLTIEESWKLLVKIASRGRYLIDAKMEQLGKNMIEHCKRLPLAVATLGGILRSKETIEKWTVVNENIHSFLTTGEGSMVMQVLELSYNELPFYLRPCFLYLSNFPEDFEIPADSLYHMWIAEGLVMSPSDDDVVALVKNGITMEDMAEKYLNELVKRCLVQVAKREKKGTIETCRVHDIIRDMCVKKAKEENFVSISSSNRKIWDLESNAPASSSYSSAVASTSARRHHRLAFHMDGSNGQSCDSSPATTSYCHLRSLFVYNANECFAKHWLRPLMGKSSVLRVLHVQSCSEIGFIPKRIGYLIHLRYLSLFHTRIEKEELPASIGKLVFLETLDLRVRYWIRVPNVLWKLTRLRHLYFPDRYGWKGSQKLELHSLSLLQTLVMLQLRSCRLEGLFKLISLRKFTWKVGTSMLDFEKEDKKSLEVLLAFLESSPSLTEMPLNILLNGGLLSEDYANKIVKLPGFNLCGGYLRIREYLVCQRLDSIKTLLEHLTGLQLTYNQFDYDPMPVLERLPNLKELTLDYDTLYGGKITCSAGGFPQLKRLELTKLSKLKEWEMEETSMPKLNYLEIKNCFRLQKLPDALVGMAVVINCSNPCIRGIERHGTCPYYKGGSRV